MRRVITFLGTHPIDRAVDYELGGRVYSGRVFAEAMLGMQGLEFDEMLVMATDRAQETTAPALAEHQVQDDRIHIVPIGPAQDEQGLWDLFHRLVERIEPGDSVVFDITHGLRYIPFVVFLAACYLRSACNVRIDAIYYGALEMGDRASGKPAPIIDLSRFVVLLDWLAAGQQLVQNGDGRALAHLVTEAGATQRPDPLKSLGRFLSEFAQAIILCRPLEVLESAASMSARLEQARNDVAQLAPPLALLYPLLIREYGSIGLEEPASGNNVALSLTRQLRLIERYLANQQVFQAVALAREWLITAVGWRLGQGYVLSIRARHDIELLLNAGRVEEAAAAPSPAIGAIAAEPTLPEMDRVRKLWDRIAGLRNDLAHAGMRPSATPARRLAGRAGDIAKALGELATIWELDKVDAHAA